MERGKLLAVREAVQLVANLELPPHKVSRWLHQGIEGITLKYVNLGNRVFCTIEDVEAFIRAVSAAKEAKRLARRQNKTARAEA